MRERRHAKEDVADGRYSLRKRRKLDGGASKREASGLDKLLRTAARCSHIVVFSGSGLSAASGMSTFSTKGGLYERAQRKFGVSDGKKLFTYSFFEKHTLDAQAFFAEIFTETNKATAGAGHCALAAFAAMGKLQRHYTLNIDGLAELVGLTTWHPVTNPTGNTVEMHGNIRQLVCPQCRTVMALDEALLRKLKAKKRVPCASCPCPAVRCRIMLYDDAQDEVITPDDVFDVMEEDLSAADLILWVGISFEQSASTEYFKRVRRYLAEIERSGECVQALINISDEALWNLLSSCSNTGLSADAFLQRFWELDVIEVLGSTDEVLPLIAASLAPDDSTPPPIQTKAGTPTPVSPRQQSCVSPKNYSKIAAATEATLTQAQRVMQELHSSGQARRPEMPLCFLARMQEAVALNEDGAQAAEPAAVSPEPHPSAVGQEMADAVSDSSPAASLRRNLLPTEDAESGEQPEEEEEEEEEAESRKLSIQGLPSTGRLASLTASLRDLAERQEFSLSPDAPPGPLPEEHEKAVELSVHGKANGPMDGVAVAASAHLEGLPAPEPPGLAAALPLAAHPA